MSCKCFNGIKPTEKSFKLKLEVSKCKCSSRFSVKEKGKQFSIDLVKDISDIDKVKIDGFFDCTSNTKCDYLFIYKKKEIPDVFVFVELKGIDTKHAIEQIETSVNQFYNNKCITGTNPVRGAIVASAMPKDNGTYRTAKRLTEKRIKTKIKNFRIEQKNRVFKYNPLEDSFY